MPVQETYKMYHLQYKTPYPHPLCLLTYLLILLERLPVRRYDSLCKPCSDAAPRNVSAVHKW